MAGRRVPESRDVLAVIWRNFRDSFKIIKRSPGQLAGKDYMGTSYFEIPADPQRGKRKPTRWFETATEEKEKFDQVIPVEWEAWLRFRRDNPPTELEIKTNEALAQMKKIKAAELEAKETSSRPPNELPSNEKRNEFPAYEEYEPPSASDDKIKR